MPAANYRTLWGWSLLAFAALLLASEFHWRRGGHLPSVTDSRQLWSAWRERLSDVERTSRPVAIVGDSRMQLGVVPGVLAHELGQPVVMLAIDGSHGYRVLADLCQDPSFNGVILCGSMEVMFFPENLDRQKSHVEFYRDFWSKPFAAFDQRVNTGIKSWLQQKLVVLSPNLMFVRQVFGWLRANPAYVVTSADRSRAAHYELLRDNRLLTVRSNIVARRLAAPLLPPERQQEYARVLRDQVGPLIRRLRERGGEVVFVKMPVTEDMLEADEHQFPRDRYWNRISQLTCAPSVHFSDFPELRGFDCPDGSHLSAGQAPQFTASLAKVLLPMLAARDGSFPLREGGTCVRPRSAWLDYPGNARDPQIPAGDTGRNPGAIEPGR